MDNASKALVMAGAVLITVMLISLVMYLVFNIREMAEASSAQTYNTQVESFNRFFIYSKPENNGRVDGADVYNIIGKALDMNNSEWAMGRVEVNYLGADYSYYSAEELKAVFYANDKALMNDTFEYTYMTDPNTGLVYEVSFSNQIVK